MGIVFSVPLRGEYATSLWVLVEFQQGNIVVLLFILGLVSFYYYLPMLICTF